MERTRLRGHDPMRTFGIKSDDVLPAPLTDGHLQFVAVSVFLFTALTRRNRNVQPCDLFQAIAYKPRLKLELHVIFKMLKLTAAAFAEHRAFRTDTDFGRRTQFLKASVTDIALYFQNTDIRTLPWQKSGDEQRHVILFGDSLSLRAERRTRDFHDIVFFHGAYLPIRRTALSAARWQRNII